MFKNIGLHFEIIDPVSIVLFLLGGILGYGGGFITKKIFKNPSEKTILLTKVIGLVLVVIGVLVIFRK
jgi:hypothetical protein